LCVRKGKEWKLMHSARDDAHVITSETFLELGRDNVLLNNLCFHSPKT